MVGLRANQTVPDQSRLAKFRVEIPLKIGSSREAALNAALDSIFLKDTEKLTDFVPQFWKLFFSGKTIPGKAEQNAWYKDSIKLDEVGVIAPQKTLTALPKYSIEARAFRCEGVLLFAGVVDKDTGKLQNIQIVLPLGLGLEESAIKTL
jgi:hypothetical protein